MSYFLQSLLNSTIILSPGQQRLIPETPLSLPSTIISSATEPGKVTALPFCKILKIEDAVRFGGAHAQTLSGALLKITSGGWRVMMRIKRLIWQILLNC